jgi:hypothetical protein
MKSTDGGGRRPFAWTDPDFERFWQGIAAAIMAAGLAWGVAEHLW